MLKSQYLRDKVLATQNSHEDSTYNDNEELRLSSESPASEDKLDVLVLRKGKRNVTIQTDNLLLLDREGFLIRRSGQGLLVKQQPIRKCYGNLTNQ